MKRKNKQFSAKDFPILNKYFQPNFNLLSDRLKQFDLDRPLFNENRKIIKYTYKEWYHQRILEVIDLQQAWYEQSSEYRSMSNFFDRIEHLKP